MTLRDPGGLTGLFVLLAALAYGAQARHPDSTWIAPADEAARTNPIVGRTDAAAGGRKIFHKRCAACHGDDGRGTSKAPNLSERDVQAQTDGTLFWKISHGNARAGMPAFSFLPEPQRWQLILHVRSLTAASAIDDDARVRN